MSVRLLDNKIPLCVKYFHAECGYKKAHNNINTPDKEYFCNEDNSRIAFQILLFSGRGVDQDSS